MLVRHHQEIVLRLAAIGHRPEQRIGVLRIDILVDGDDPFAGKTVQRRGAVKRPPDFGFRRAPRELDSDHGIEAGQRLVHGDALDGFDREHGAQVIAETSGSMATRRITLDSLGVTWLMKDGQDRVAPPRDRGDVP